MDSSSTLAVISTLLEFEVTGAFGLFDALLHLRQLLGQVSNGGHTYSYDKSKYD
jgi:hypothetical protein